MSRFKHLNTNINNILLHLLNNQNLCKLLYYNSSDPLSEPDIDDPSSLLFNKIYPLPKIPDTTSEAGTILCVFFDHFILPNSNTGVKSGTITIDIISHIDLWRLDGMIRPFSILHEIDSIFNQERIAGVKELQFDRGSFLYINESFAGYQVRYRMVSGN